jgi:teichuronic acid exporter
MPDSLKKRTISAGLWNLTGTGARTLAQLAISIVLARLLSPSDFGLFAMILVFPALGRIFVEGGFGIALIHNKNATREEETSILAFNTSLALLIYGALWVIAPLVADFYKQPSLIDLLRFAAIGMVFNALGMVQGSVLARKLNYKAIASVSMTSSILSGVAAIGLALAGIGVWALAWQGVISALFNTLFLWWASPWRPVRTISLKGLRTMGAYGSRMLASNIVTVIFDNLNSILIGRLYSPADLGYYSRAASTQGMPINAFSSAIGQVMVPALVHINDKPDDFRRAYSRAIQAVFAISAPVMAAGIVLATPLFTIVFSEKWLPAVPFFQVLCIRGALYPVHLLNINMLLALGRPGLYLKLEVIKRSISLVVALIAIQHSIMALVIASTAFTPIMLAINTYYSGKMVGFGFWKQVVEIAPYAINSLIAGGVTYWILPYLPQAEIFQLALGTIIFFCIAAVLPLLFRNNIYFYLMKNNPFVGRIANKNSK